jgi:hypothetical protein
VIVIVGAPAWREVQPAGPAGRTCQVAVAAAARGARVEVVGRVGDDAAGDALLIALALAGVGHAAVLRDPVRPTPIVHPGPEPADPFADAADAAVPEPRSEGPRLEPADVRLGLSYLTSFGVLVVADDAPAEVLAASIEGAAFAGATLVVLVPQAAVVPGDLPAGTTVLAAPDAADDGAFARLVGAFVAALDEGADATDAFRAATGGAGWTAAEAGEPS